ncbi:MAG: RyR domain-containing protein [Gaiellales bacterium]
MAAGGERRDGRFRRARAPEAGSGLPATALVAQGRAFEEEYRRHPAWPSLRRSVWAWLTLTAVAVAAYGLAVAYGSGPLPHRMLDALKLFPSGFPGYDESMPWPHLLARYLAALVSLFVTLRVLAAVFADRFAQLRARTRRGHAVVCGLGETGLRSTLALRTARRPVTCIDLAATGDAADAARRAGALVLKADATQVVALRTARVDRADQVVCACEADATNARIATTARALAAGRLRDPLDIHVSIRDPDLAQALRNPSSALAGARIHVFNVTAVWARALLDDPAGPFERATLSPPRLVVAGAGPLGRAVVRGAARRWHDRVRDGTATGTMAIVVAATDATEACAHLGERYPAVARTSRLIPAPAVASHGDTTAPGGLEARPDAVYLCLPDQSANLAAALDADRALQGRAPVFLPASSAVAELGSLGVGGPGLHPVALPTHSTSLDVLHDQRRDALARSVHEEYLVSRQAAADFGTRPGDRDWELLPESLRAASRDHADRMVEQLGSLWYELEPRYDWDEPLVELPAPTVEALAELEHERWRAERHAAGWRLGTARDDDRKLHDLLVPWTELPQDAKELDRALVRARPELLARADYRLGRSRVRELLAQRLHERYVSARLSETPAAAVPGWSELPEAQRELNRSSVDDIGVKLARIGCRAALAVPSLPAAAISPSELERLAELEHERWLEERYAAGWRVGPRDTDAGTHPSLVPWAELSEAEREKDREVVRSIQPLLAEVGYAVVRYGLG